MNGRVPRYHHIAEELRERIQSGGLGPGFRLPNQRRLARDFGVTLMTVRHALELLERDNLIRRQHGLGTFVAAPSIDYDILQLRRLVGELRAQGEPVSTRLLSSRFVAADRRETAAPSAWAPPPPPQTKPPPLVPAPPPTPAPPPPS